MKKIKSLALLSIILFLTFTSSFGQSVEERNVGSFDEIRASEAIDVYIKPGSKESVRVEASGINIRDVLTDVSGGRLKIHLDEGRHRNHRVKVYVTFVDLSALIASSASGIFSEGTIKSDELYIKVSSAADIEVDVNVKELSASASSSGDMELSGKTIDLEVDVSSAGSVDAYDMDADNVRARANSAGGIKVNAAKEINARASSGGSIRYRGKPTRSQTDSSSGGSVRHSN